MVVVYILNTSIKNKKELRIEFQYRDIKTYFPLNINYFITDYLILFINNLYHHFDTISTNILNH